MGNFNSSFEVLVLEGSRWNVKHVADSQGDAMATAVELTKRGGINGVRVIKDFYDESSGLSYEKVLYEQLREKKQGRVRTASS